MQMVPSQPRNQKRLNKGRKKKLSIGDKLMRPNKRSKSISAIQTKAYLQNWNRRLQTRRQTKDEQAKRYGGSNAKVVRR